VEFAQNKKIIAVVHTFDGYDLSITQKWLSKFNISWRSILKVPTPCSLKLFADVTVLCFQNTVAVPCISVFNGTFVHTPYCHNFCGTLKHF